MSVELLEDGLDKKIRKVRAIMCIENIHTFFCATSTDRLPTKIVRESLCSGVSSCGTCFDSCGGFDVFLSLDFDFFISRPSISSGLSLDFLFFFPSFTMDCAGVAMPGAVAFAQNGVKSTQRKKIVALTVE